MTKKTLIKFGPPLKKLSGSAHVGFKRLVLQITYKQKLANDAMIINLLCMYIVDLSVFKCLVFRVSKYLIRDCGFA